MLMKKRMRVVKMNNQKNILKRKKKVNINKNPKRKNKKRIMNHS